jgi:uncharacterized protein YuzE
MGLTPYDVLRNPKPEIKTDQTAGAVYAKLSDKPFAKTKLVRDDEITVTVDLPADGEVIGIEVVGSSEPSLVKILELARI